MQNPMFESSENHDISDLPKILSMSPAHVDRVVQIHLESFTGFFLSFLGRGFLRLFYSEVLKYREHVALVATDKNGEVEGFVVGVVRQGDFYRCLIQKRLLSFAIASLMAVLRQPAIIPRLFRALNYPSASQASAAQASLMSIAMVPSAQGRGIGQQLVRAFLEQMKMRRVLAVTLTTDRDNNDRVNAFYHKLGFHIVRTVLTPEGRYLNEYAISLD